VKTKKMPAPVRAGNATRSSYWVQRFEAAVDGDVDALDALTKLLEIIASKRAKPRGRRRSA
jgi:hypothetical protein